MHSKKHATHYLLYECKRPKYEKEPELSKEHNKLYLTYAKYIKKLMQPKNTTLKAKKKKKVHYLSEKNTCKKDS